MKGLKMLKVTSILMIIGCVLSIVISVIGAVAAGLFAVATLNVGAILLLCLSLLLLAVSTIVRLVASIKGLNACKAPQLASSCVTWGIVVVALEVVAAIVESILGDGFEFFDLLLNLVIPGLYVWGAVRLKQSANEEILL